MIKRTSGALLIALAAPLAGQAPSYKAPPREVFVGVVNPYRMYWLRGSDTVGAPVRDVTLETESWRRTGNNFEILVNQQTLDARRQVRSDTFVVEQSGRVTQINNKPPGVHERVDLLLRLPAEPLAIGLKWSDTLDHSADGVGGRHRYMIQRSYEVVSELDTLGHHVERIAATGTVAYRDGWWADSAKGRFYSIDVAGPVTESFLFDAREGQLVTRSWKMDLRGTGTLPADQGTADTLRAGLLSEETQIMLDPSVARAVGRPLPLGDTSFTISEGLLFVHTVHRMADTIESGFGRNGGLVGTARVVFSNGSPVFYRATWTDGFDSSRTNVIERRGNSLSVSRERGDTMLSVPNGPWGIADYAMQELLVPVILSLPLDGAPHPFSIYRPYAAHWDSGAVVVRSLTDARIAILQMAGDKKPQALLITKDGDYLYGENSDPVGAERIPLLGSSRRSRLDGFLKAMRGQ